jgi:hypothetical protein
VYNIALYGEEGPARSELRRLQDEGFFDESYGVSRLCEALEVGVFNKVVQISLLRHITSLQFTGALNDSLEPRLRGSGEPKSPPPPPDLFCGQQKHCLFCDPPACHLVSLLHSVGGALQLMSDS